MIPPESSPSFRPSHRLLERLAAVLSALILGALLPPAEAAPVIACEAGSRNLAVYRQIHEVLFMQRDVTRIAEFYAPEVISHNNDAGGDGARRVTHAQLAAIWAASKRDTPDRRLDDELILCAGEFVIVRTRIASRDTTGVAGHPPTGRSFRITAIDIYRFEDGKVVERWGNADLASQYAQLGYALAPR